MCRHRRKLVRQVGFGPAQQNDGAVSRAATVVSAATTVTTVLFLALWGVLADRHDRLRILMGAHALDWIKSAVLAALALTRQLTLPLICISAVAHGFIHSFSIPASYGLLPRFVAKEKLASAIGVAAAHTQFAIFAGPAVGLAPAGL